MKENIMLSVIIISYKQEKYIREAIESVLNQKTKYKYEILLADDCSPDNTKEILKEYEKKYPELIRILPREKNLGASNNLLDAYYNCNCKYITVLEGDDYWIDENKIQIQLDFLENNQEYIGISHKQEWRDLDNKILDYAPRWVKKDTDMTLEKHIKGFSMSGSSTVYRNIFRNKEEREDIKHLLGLNAVVGDTQLCFYLLTKGKIKILNHPMMVYRFRNNSNETNYNSTHSTFDIDEDVIEIYTKINEYFNYKYNFFNIYLNCMSSIFLNQIIKKDFGHYFKTLKKCPQKYRLLISLLLPIKSFKIVVKKIKSFFKF